MIDFEHLRLQYGVGQGSFHAAYVAIKDGAKEFRFDYVYDCGALVAGRPDKAVLRCIKHYEPRHEFVKTGKGGAETVIDALVLSHFDYDHMRGAEELATRHDVRRLFLPYLSPEELVLHIARGAEHSTAWSVNELFVAAHDDRMWNVPVTRVRTGARGDGEPAGIGKRDGRPPEGIHSDTPQASREEQSDRQGYARPMRPVVASTGQPVGRVLDDDEDVHLQADGLACWQLRFWNHGSSDELLFFIISLLELIGFPLHAVHQPGGAATVSAWLNIRNNRDGAVEAYAVALEMALGPLTPKQVTKEPANFISLAMFSAPLAWPEQQLRWRRSIYSSSHFQQSSVPWGDRQTWRVGWLGTGDALLGEATVWKDFAGHYKLELDRVRTVLLPHHGAAPFQGSRFYNRRLNLHPGTSTVISVGTSNNHGHPKSEVVREVLKRRGILHVITEYTWPGLVELVMGHLDVGPTVAANATTT